MTRWERWAFNVFTLAVTVSGGAYFVMKDLLPHDDPFAVINHPWQPTMLATHVVAAPCLILVFGIVLRSHILGQLLLNARPNRRTGWVSLASFAAMGLSGYLLQVVADPTWLRGLAVTHVATSLVFLAGYTTHLLIGWRLSHRSIASATMDTPLPTVTRLS